jgi:hypothetical protein
VFMTLATIVFMGLNNYGYWYLQLYLVHDTYRSTI